METTIFEKESLNNYYDNQEYIANSYVMKCFMVSMIVYCICFLLNLLNIFIIDQKIMLMGFIPSMIIYLLMIIMTKKVSLSSKKIKYFILFSVVLVFTCIGVTITYHVVIIAVLPILYAMIYSSKKVIWYTYCLTVFSTIIIVFVGYYYGLCDANMTLLTTTKLGNYLADGQFILNAINEKPSETLLLYFVIPRCLIYVAVLFVCDGIFKIINEGLKKARHIVQMEVFQKELKKKVDEQTIELREQNRKIQEAYWQTVSTLSEAVDAKDRYTSGHSKRVAEYARMIAKRMGKSIKEQEMIYRAGLLHDVGKIGIPINIINKTDKLTDEEFELIKIHPITGYHILKEISEYGDMVVATKYHHERYDGKGYPNGLAGENIPEIARILCVADSYDAMTSNRSYRKGLPQEAVKNEIEKCKGKQFDPYIADIMIQIMEEDKEYLLRQIDRTDYKILLVGDNNENNLRIQKIIQEDNIYEVILVDNLEQVMERLDNIAIDLIIFDIKTDQNKSWQILQKIKEKYHIPMVLMSNDNNIRNTKEFIELGCDDYITHYFRPLMIKEVVSKITKK